MTTLLPQNDPDKALRAAKLNLERDRVKYRYDYAGLVLAKSTPVGEGFTAAYLANAVKLQLTLKANQAASSFARLVDGADTPAAEGSLADHVRSALGIMRQGMSDRALASDDFLTIFKEIERPLAATLPADDLRFARERIAGTNPILLRGIDRLPDHFPVTEAHFSRSMPATDSLERAGQDGRLFLLDYRQLDGIEHATSTKTARYLFSPLALFCRTADERAALMPVAIQCGQLPGAQQPIRTPADGAAWQLARHVVQVADFNWKGALAHFGLNHLVIEGVLLAARRELAPNHPLMVLFAPHFDLTIAANQYTADAVAGPDGIMDHVLGGSLEGVLERVRQAVENVDLRELDPTFELALRNVDSVDALPDYPFRDDGLLVWGPVHAFVEKYLRLYYGGDADVAADTELAAFLLALGARDGSRMSHFFDGGPVQTLHQLIGLVAGVIYRASAFHAAINYSGFDWMTYPPSMASCAAAPLPGPGVAVTDELLVNMLPPFDIAYEALHLQYLASMTRVSQLGVYPPDHFTDGRVQPLVDAFLKQLADVEQIIDGRNALRPWPYTYMKPSWIPNSIAA